MVSSFILGDFVSEERGFAHRRSDEAMPPWLANSLSYSMAGLQESGSFRASWRPQVSPPLPAPPVLSVAEGEGGWGEGGRVVSQTDKHGGCPYTMMRVVL